MPTNNIAHQRAAELAAIGQRENMRARSLRMQIEQCLAIVIFARFFHV
jgi:hypothetical protein